MRLDLRRLTYFKAIADAGSLSEAARRLSVPQPALSYHVKELETEFGAPLLNRAQNGATVTEAGQLLLDHATIITAQVARASEEMRRFRERGTARHGAIRLSALPSLATPLVPLLLSRASAELSNAGVYVIEFQYAGSAGYAQFRGDRFRDRRRQHLCPPRTANCR